MARLFFGPRRKLRRAQRKIQTLKRLIDRWVEANPYGIYAEFNPQTGDHVLRAYARDEPREAPLVQWSIIVGEIAYNLRSALDQAVCELATSRNAPCDRTSFPIFQYGARAKRRKDRSGRALNFSWKGAAIAPLSYRHRRIIEGVQPYHRVDTYQVAYPRGKRRPFYSLWMLHEMNNADKHRTILEMDTAPLESAISVTNLSLSTDWELDYAAPVYDDAPVGWLRSPTGEQVKVDGYLALQVAFSDRGTSFGTWNVIHVLEWIAKTVRNVLYDLERGEPWRTRGAHLSASERHI